MAARQTFLSITNSWNLLKLVSIKPVTPSNHLILCRPLLPLLSIFPSIRVFSSESVLRIRWPKDWSFSFSISPSDEYSGLISFRRDWLDLLAVQGNKAFLGNNVSVDFFYVYLSLAASGLSCGIWDLSLWHSGVSLAMVPVFQSTWALYMQHTGSLVVACRLSCPVACGILVPRSGIELASPALEGRFLITGPLGKSLTF